MLVRKRYKRCRFKKRYLIILAAVVLIGFLIHGFEAKVSVFSKSYIPSFARRSATEAVNDAVLQKLEDLGLDYADLATLKYDASGAVKAIETNATAINTLKSSVTRAAQDELTKIKHSAIKIPLGAFTGFTLIANYGPEIKLTYCMTGSFNSRLESVFESAGINNTIHHIRLIVSADIVTASVDYEETMSFETDFEIAQTVFAGDIPTIYGRNTPVY